MLKRHTGPIVTFVLKPGLLRLVIPYEHEATLKSGGGVQHNYSKIIFDKGMYSTNDPQRIQYLREHPRFGIDFFEVRPNETVNIHKGAKLEIIETVRTKQEAIEILVDRGVSPQVTRRLATGNITQLKEFAAKEFGLDFPNLQASAVVSSAV